MGRMRSETSCIVRKKLFRKINALADLIDGHGCLREVGVVRGHGEVAHLSALRVVYHILSRWRRRLCRTFRAFMCASVRSTRVRIRLWGQC
jgi:hypothetical protein